MIWTSPALPEDPIIWRKDLDPAVKEKLRQFFLTYGRATRPDAERQRANLRPLSIGGFEPADDNHLLPVREMEATRDTGAMAEDSGDAAKIAPAQRRRSTTSDAQGQALEGAHPRPRRGAMDRCAPTLRCRRPGRAAVGRGCSTWWSGAAWPSC